MITAIVAVTAQEAMVNAAQEVMVLVVMVKEETLESMVNAEATEKDVVSRAPDRATDKLFKLEKYRMGWFHVDYFPSRYQPFLFTKMLQTL